MESQFNVVFTGELQPGTDRDTFIQAFCQRFKTDEAKATEVHDAGKAITMKTGVSQIVAEEFKKALEGLGMVVRLDPVIDTGAEMAPAASEQQKSDETANPYQAPSANLEQSAALGEMTGPASVPFGHGWQWIVSAYSNHFKGNAISWIGALIVLFVLNVVTQLIPLLGFIVISILSPVLAGGLMIGARAQDDGESFTVGHLFSGFKQSTGQLILFGVLYLVATILIMLLVFATVGGSFAMFGMTGDPAATEAMMQQNPAAILLPVLVMMLLFIPLMMAYWFSPALIAINGVSAINAMKMSFIGCIKNILPFLLYGIMMMILMVVAMIPLGLGLLVLMPVMMASMYTAYRDIYYSAE